MQNIRKQSYRPVYRSQVSWPRQRYFPRTGRHQGICLASTGSVLPNLHAGDLIIANIQIQGISVELSNFDPLVSEIAFEKVFKGFHGGGAADEALVAKLTTKLEGTLAGYERILSQQKYLTGDKVTLADLFHLPYGTFLENLGFSEIYSKYPAFYKC